MNKYQQNKKHRTLNNYKKTDTCHNQRNPLYGGKTIFRVKNTQNGKNPNDLYNIITQEEREKYYKKQYKKDIQYPSSKTVKGEDEPS